MMVQISVINESSAISDAAVQAMLPAFQHQWNNDLLPIWGVDTASLTFLAKGIRPATGSWWVVFLDNSDQAKALAYHDLTNEGLPISKVFVKTLQQDNASVSVGATHEICEMAVDPWLNGAYQDSRNVFWAAEICDPVESDQYGYTIDGVLVTDFVTPSWFAHKHSPTGIDFKGHASRAFEVLSSGYAQKFEFPNGWVQITGAQAALASRHQPSIGSRRERRARLRGSTGRTSEHQF